MDTCWESELFSQGDGSHLLQDKNNNGRNKKNHTHSTLILKS